MKTASRLGIAIVVLSILAPVSALAQFETLEFVDLPAVGSWAEYRVTLGNTNQRTVTSQKVAFLSSQKSDEGWFYWFQLESESDDYGPKRVPVVIQFAVSKEAAHAHSNLFSNIRELIVQVGDAPAFRVARSFIELGMTKGLLGGGAGGAGSPVDYLFRDLDVSKVKTKAGEFECKAKKGIGKAWVVLSLESPERFEVDSISELWYSDEIPFGLVRQVVSQSGDGPSERDLAMVIDSEQTVELTAFGAGARSAVKGEVFEYDPSLARELQPAGN